jgi:lipopolysaccharide assembly outer membrane protein LptD (OstA)
MKLRILATLLAAFLVAAAPKPPPQGRAVGFGLSDWHVTTGQLDANWQTGAFSTPGRIELTRPGSDISADHAVGNFKNHSATLTGNVVLHDNNGVLTNFAGQNGSHAPATLTCNNLTIDGVSKTYVATGSVHFIQGGSDVRADRAVMNGVTHDLHLYGHVELQQ